MRCVAQMCMGSHRPAREVDRAFSVYATACHTPRLGRSVFIRRGCRGAVPALDAIVIYNEHRIPYRHRTQPNKQRHPPLVKGERHEYDSRNGAVARGRVSEIGRDDPDGEGGC